jgi:hypothetical protein
VLGSHGHSALFETLVGGTAAGVIEGAKCPVIVIPPLHVRKTQNQRGRPLRRRHPVAWLRRSERRVVRIRSSTRDGRRSVLSAL